MSLAVENIRLPIFSQITLSKTSNCSVWLCVLASACTAVAFGVRTFPEWFLCVFSDRQGSHVDHQETYGFILLCGSNMRLWWGIKLLSMWGEYAQTLVQKKTK